MKFKTLSMAVMIDDSNIKALEFYYGSFDDDNLILKIKDIVKATKQEGDLVVYIENNEDVKEYVIYNNTLSVLLK